MKSPLFVAVLVAILAGCPGRSREADPEVKGLYQAARAIEAALEVGVTYSDFGTLIRDLSKELVLERDRAKFAAASPDASLAKTIQQYEHLLSMYKDSSTVWKLQIEDKKYDDALPRLAEKYGVPSAIRNWKNTSYGITTNERHVNYDQVRQAIWEKATQLQEELAASAYGRIPLGPAHKEK